MKCVNPIIMTPLGIAQTRYERQDGQYIYVYGKEYFAESEVMKFPCRKCFYCLQDRARELSLRCGLERKMYDDACVLTLTYAESPRSVSKRDVQLFVKRLRKAMFHVEHIAYVCCGEYGSRTMRPHYHCILLGYCPNKEECVVWTQKNGRCYYRNMELELIWGHGLVTIDLAPTAEAISYSCGYTVGKAFQKYPEGLEPPFVLMSRKPAIGKRWLDENAFKLYEHDQLYFDGEVKRPPKYFDRKYKEVCDSYQYEDLVYERTQKMREESHKMAFETNMYRLKEKLKKVLDKRDKL